ncbi:MAG: hypothetical protein AAGF47_10590 [Planctomycetota bacterium]
MSVLRWSIVAIAVVILAGCSARQADGWSGPSFAAYSTLGTSTIPVLVRDSEHPPETRDAARRTLGRLYELIRNLDHIAQNREEVRRTDAQWDKLSAALRASYAELEAAAALPAETLALGDDSEQIRLTIENARRLITRFGGGLAFDRPLPPLRR